MIHRTDAIVLRKFPYSESSLILTLFTRSQGKIQVIAKGARRIKSKFGAALQPLSYVQVVYYQKETRELQNLSDATLALPMPNIQRDLTKIRIGLQALELTQQVLEHHEPQPILFNLLLEILVRLDKLSGNEQHLFFAYQLKLLETLGFKPDIHKQAVEAIGTEGGWFLPDTGAMYPHAIPEKTAIRYSRQALRAFAIFALSDLETAQRLVLSSETQAEVRQMTDLFLQKHLEDYKSSKTAKVFAQMQP